MKKMYVIQTFTRTPRIPNNTCGHVAITIHINGRRQEEIIFHSDLFSQCKNLLGAWIKAAEGWPLSLAWRTGWQRLVIVGCLSLSTCLPCKSDGFFPLNSFPCNSGDQRQQLTDCHRKSDFIFCCTGAACFLDFCLTFFTSQKIALVFASF